LNYVITPIFRGIAIAGMKYLAEYDNHSSLKPIPLDELPELIGKVVWSDTKW
jgi:hypothetical protein